MPPLVSIILPTYNRAAFLPETLGSICAQTYQHWELLVIDDGSGDDTAQVMRTFSDPRIRFIEAGRTGIAGKLKNLGIRLSKGAFIAFNDSDDLWHPQKLEKQVAVLLQDPGLGFCLTGGYNFSKEKITEYFYPSREGQRSGSLFKAIFNSEVACFTQALMARRSCLETAGHFREEGSFSDVEFIARLAWHFEGSVLFEPLVFRRLHEENYIHSSWEKSYQEGVALICRQEDKLPALLKRQALFRLYIRWGEKYIARRKPIRAILQFFRAWKYRPLSTIPFKKIGKALLAFR